MFVYSTLVKKINEDLYKLYTKRYPYIKNHLPFKNPTREQTLKLIDILKAETIVVLLRDVLTLMDGRKTVESTFALNQMNRQSILESKVKLALNSADGIVQQVAFLLGMYDKDACIVGGCVRDSLTDTKPKDWDFVSSKSYEELEEQFSRAGYTINETGKQFLVLNISKNGETFEIARFRKDGMYTDGRHPDSVEVGTITEDSERRDFTVNALYYNLSSDALLDPTGQGIIDIMDRTLRFVGSPEKRLEEDSLRAIRFYRFVSKGFKPESKSLTSVRRLFDKSIKQVTPERVRIEIERIVGL